MNIQGSVTVITGASRGIGLATARRFAAAGAKVVLAARSADLLAAAAEELCNAGQEALAIRTDMRDKAQVERLIEQAYAHYGRIDILINNAGQGMAAGIPGLNIDWFRQILDLNVLGALYGMQAVIPKMRQTGGGIIINISSMVSQMNIPNLAGYASTKAALNMLSATARAELAPENIRVITVFPRITLTDFGRNAFGNQEAGRQMSLRRPDIVRDTAEFVAERILAAAETEPPEQYMDK